MRATVTKAFPGRPDNAEQTREIAVGEVIDGELAEVAIRERWATPLKGEPKKRGIFGGKGGDGEAEGDGKAEADGGDAGGEA